MTSGMLDGDVASFLLCISWTILDAAAVGGKCCPVGDVSPVAICLIVVAPTGQYTRQDIICEQGCKSLALCMFCTVLYLVPGSTSGRPLSNSGTMGRLRRAFDRA